MEVVAKFSVDQSGTKMAASRAEQLCCKRMYPLLFIYNHEDRILFKLIYL